MTRSVARVSSSVAFVHRGDLDGRRRVVRTLVIHPDLPEDILLLPVDSDDARLLGLELERGELDPETWQELDPPEGWPRGQVPVALSPTGLVFWTRAQLAASRRADAAQALLNAQTGDAERRTAAIEAADLRLGGHPLTTAALLVLAEDEDGGPYSSMYDSIRERHLESAPNGPSGVARELGRPEFARLRDERAWSGAIMGAAVRAAEPTTAFRVGAWQDTSERTLWSWWSHVEARAHSTTLRGLAQRLSVAPGAVVRLARGEAPPDELGLAGSLPSREDALETLRRSFEDRPGSNSPAPLKILAAHGLRFSLFSRQLAALGRAIGDRTLDRWVDGRRRIGNIRDMLRVRSYAQPWLAARSAAQELRRTLQLTEERVEALQLLDRLGVELASGELPFRGQEGTSWSTPGASATVFLGCATVSRSATALRFAVLHQLGHLVLGAGGCSKWADDEDAGGHGDDESFANAFAAYLAAPRHLVSAVIGEPREVSARWLQSAARDVSLTFGLGPEAAVPHVLNCLHEPAQRWVSTMRGDEAWRDWRTTLQGKVEPIWTEEAAAIRSRADAPDESGVEVALLRPRSSRFNALLTRAQEDRLLPPATTDDWA